MDKILKNKAVLRELLPYVLYIMISIIILDGGVLYVLSVSGEKLRGYFTALAGVDILMLMVGATLLIWHFFRYIFPVKDVVGHMGREEELVDYKEVSSEIIGYLEDYKACKLRLGQMESIVRMDFVDKLLNAEYKSKPQLLAEAENVGIEVYGYRYIILVATIFNNVADEDVDAATIHESTVVLDYLKLEMDWQGRFHDVWFRKISYRRMAIVLQLKEEFQIETLHELGEKFQREHGVNIFWGVGRCYDDPLYLWRSKMEAYAASDYCSVANVCVEYSEKLEAEMKCYLPSAAKNNLQACIRSGNITETRKILDMLKEENCVRRELSHHQFVNLNSKFIRLLEKFQDQGANSVENMIDQLNDCVLGDDGNRETYFERLTSYCAELCEKYGEEKKDKKNQLAGEIKSFIDGHYQDSSLSLTRIGLEFNISDSYVSLIFKEYIGVKFSTYVEEIRIGRAMQLLESSSLTIREIAELTGYSNEQSFRRAFKKVKGVSPKDARITVNVEMPTEDAADRRTHSA